MNTNVRNVVDSGALHKPNESEIWHSLRSIETQNKAYRSCSITATIETAAGGKRTYFFKPPRQLVGLLFVLYICWISLNVFQTYDTTQRNNKHHCDYKCTNRVEVKGAFTPSCLTYVQLSSLSMWCSELKQQTQVYSEVKTRTLLNWSVDMQTRCLHFLQTFKKYPSRLKAILGGQRDVPLT